MAHYANAATDIEFHLPFGFKEVEGIHSRTDFDLSQHEKFSGRGIKYFDPERNESYVPYDVETSISNKISILTKYPPKEIKGLDGVLDMLESVFEIKYNELQRKAIKSSLENRINIITGGPGTGKTTIIKGIVEAYKQIEKITDDKLINDMVLLASTGRAARRIMEATNFSAFTIHKFLKWDKETDTFQINKFNFIVGTTSLSIKSFNIWPGSTLGN